VSDNCICLQDGEKSEKKKEKKEKRDRSPGSEAGGKSTEVSYSLMESRSNSGITPVMFPDQCRTYGAAHAAVRTAPASTAAATMAADD